VIEALRRLRMTASEIAEILQLPLSTVSAWLKRIGLGKRSRLEPPEPPNRYERRHPGELVHVDIKKLGRIRGAGHRMTGSRASQAMRRREGRLRDISGWEYVHVMVDVECPRFRGQLSAGLSGPAERLCVHAKEAEVPKALPAGVPP